MSISKYRTEEKHSLACCSVRLQRWLSDHTRTWLHASLTHDQREHIHALATSSAIGRSPRKRTVQSNQNAAMKVLWLKLRQQDTLQKKKKKRDYAWE